MSSLDCLLWAKVMLRINRAQAEFWDQQATVTVQGVRLVKELRGLSLRVESLIDMRCSICWTMPLASSRKCVAQAGRTSPDRT